MDNLIYAVGDIHGMYLQLIELYDKIEKDAGKHPFKIIFLGDYVDRGLESRQVINFLMKLEKQGHVCLKGNHEDMMVKLFDTGSIIYVDLHLNNGGMETLESYGLSYKNYEWNAGQPTEIKKLLIDYKKAIGNHYDWIKSLKTLHFEDDCVFVHAGVDPAKTIYDQDEQTLLWWRKHKWIDIMGFPHKIIHGHTPVQKPDVTQFRINVDTASCFGGCLTAAKLVDGKLVGFLNTGDKIF
jgi:serine/threonine protein phosphatase 1